MSPDNALRQASEGGSEQARPVRSEVTHQRPKAHHYHSSVAGSSDKLLQVRGERRWMTVDGETAHENAVWVDRSRVIQGEVRVDEPIHIQPTNNQGC